MKKQFIEKLTKLIFGENSISQSTIMLGSIFEGLNEIIPDKKIKTIKDWREYKKEKDIYDFYKELIRNHYDCLSNDMYKKSHVPIQIIEKKYFIETLNKILKVGYNNQNKIIK